MTFSALDWMRGVRDSRWSSPAKAVAHALALRADEFGNAWPSIDQLALDAGLGRTAAKAALTSLRRVNAVAVASGSAGRVVNRYQLQPVASWLVEELEPEPKPVVSRPVEPVTSRPVVKQPVATRPTTGRLTTSNRSPDDQDLPKNCPRTAQREIEPHSAVVVADGSEHGKLQRHYAEAYRRATGAEHVLARGQGSRHGRAIQDLLAACRGDVMAACVIVDRALADPWQRAKRPELWNIAADVNKFRGSAPVSNARASPGSNVNRLKARVERFEREEREEQERRNAAQ